MPRLGADQAALYAAEARSLDHRGQRWRRLAEAQGYLDGLIQSSWFFDRWPAFVACTVERRGRGSVWSTHEHLDADGPDGTATEGVILVADGCLGQPVILHELAHLLHLPGTGHTAEFATTQLSLVRHEMGFFAFADYLDALRDTGRFTTIDLGDTSAHGRLS